jgi:hypothetical protein
MTDKEIQKMTYEEFREYRAKFVKVGKINLEPEYTIEELEKLYNDSINSSR